MSDRMFLALSVAVSISFLRWSMCVLYDCSESHIASCATTEVERVCIKQNTDAFTRRQNLKQLHVHLAAMPLAYCEYTEFIEALHYHNWGKPLSGRKSCLLEWYMYVRHSVQ